MPWTQALSTFFAALFLTNAIPHFVQGISGNPFPSPFSKPPGKGLSSPLTNVLWGLLNFAVGGLLWAVNPVSPSDRPALAVFSVGVVLMSVLSSINFAKKDKA